MGQLAASEAGSSIATTAVGNAVVAVSGRLKVVVVPALVLERRKL
jgi:hypothetical protein